MDTGFTVADALTVPAMKHASLVAGETGLQNVVRWVHILDIPDVVPWVSQGDLVLTSGFQFSVRPGTVDGLVPRLADKRVSGMVLAVGAYLQDVPRQLIADANRCGFPLVKISSRIRFEDMTHQLISKLLYNPRQILERADQAAAELTLAVGSGVQMETLCNSIASALRKDIVLAFSVGPSVRSAGVSDAAFRAVTTLHGRPANGHHPTSSPPAMVVEGRRLLIRPLTAGEQVVGQIVVLSDSDFTPLDLLTISHVAGLISVKLAVQRERQKAARSTRTEFLRQLLLSPPTDTVDLRARANLLGLRDGDPYVVVAIHAPQELSSALSSGMRDSVVEAVGQLLQQGMLPFLLDCENATVMLVPLRLVGGGAAHLRQGVEDAIRRGSLAVTVGISDEAHKLCEASSKLGQATRVAELSSRLNGHGTARSYSDMRAFDLLDQLGASQPEVEFAIVPGLSELLEADKEHGLNLVETVKTYLRCGGNLERTASRLYLHRNSVRYRIERAKGYLGTMLSDPSQWLQLEMALAIRSLREPRPSSTKRQH
ncbi:MAG TPA: PucR family transcriptional regulator ligand-binding domain-containing protein [Candidatus Dormibacteraeota bacterium]